MIRKVEYDMVGLYYNDEIVNYTEAMETLKADIEATKKYFSSEGRGGSWPTKPWYKNELVPIYGDVVYILTDRGWLNNKQRADIIRQGNTSSDYEIIEPMQSKTQKEIVRYETKRVMGGTSDVSLGEAVRLYWFYTHQTKTSTDDKMLDNSRYGAVCNKPIEYLTEDEIYVLSNNNSPILSKAIDEGKISQKEIDSIIEEFDALY